ncbi:MAG: Type 1 glutamine amidotransferase-like domain-containing protein [Candidatus Woesearchaeota archaeon]
MGTIVAIGGGEIGRPKKSGGRYPIETTAIDKEIIRLSKKKNPKVLFIPTASKDSESYYEVFKRHYTKLGAKVDVLYLTKKQYSYKELESRILSTDIIYVGGGNTLYMMNLWRKLKVDKILKKAFDKNIILSGLSAGSICWFSFGISDSRTYKHNPKALTKVRGLGFVPAIICPHYDTEIHRHSATKKYAKTSPLVTLALDNCSAFAYTNERFRILTTKKSAKAQLIYYKQNRYYKKKILETKDFQNVQTLFTKK